MTPTTTTSELDLHRKYGRKGQEFWMGRDIASLLGYADWTNFENVVEKAKTACQTAGLSVHNHFRETTEKVTLGSDAKGKRKTYFISRYGCYLIAMNGDPTKPQIALAQTYFAVQTRRQEVADQLSVEEQRIVLRDQLAKATMALNSVAKKAGVQQYGLFHDAGYRGLYGMGLGAIKERKGLAENEQLFDCAGRSELAANYFRAAQAAERIERLKITGQQNANDTHEKVGREVRKTIETLGNTMPEDLAPAPHIRTIQKRNKSAKEIADSLLLPPSQGGLASDTLTGGGA